MNVKNCHHRTFVGVIIITTLCVVSVYAMLLLVKVKYKLCREDYGRFYSYADIGEAAFGSFGRVLVEGVLTVAHVGFCCAYLIFIGKTLETVTPVILIFFFVLLLLKKKREVCLS